MAPRDLFAEDPEFQSGAYSETGQPVSQPASGPAPGPSRGQGQDIFAGEEVIDNEGMSKPTGRGNIAHPMLQGLSFGWGDEALAGVLAAYGTLMPEAMGGLPDNLSLEDNYKGIRDTIRQSGDLYQQENPGKSMAGEAAGALLTGGAGIAKLGGRAGMGMGQRLLRNAAVGAGEGAVYGAGKADEMEDVPDAAKEGAAWGAAGGAVAGEVGHQAKKLFDKRSALKDAIETKLKNKQQDTSTALYKLEQDYFGNYRLADDPVAMEAVAQGMDRGVIPSVKRATPLERTQMRKMTNIAKRILDDTEYGMKKRPTDVVGDSMMRRFNIVLKANRDAGSQIDEVAKGLQSKSVDFRQPVSQFQDDLRNMGINLRYDQAKKKVIPDFAGSDIEDVKPAENIIRHVVNRMNKGDKITAYDVHRMKRYIDEHVSWGEAGEGLSGKTVNILKKLRRNLDDVLDQNFPQYKLVNDTYSETIDVLDELQGVAGKQINLTSKRAREALGQEMRGVMSNRKSRVRLLNALEAMEDVAEKYAGKQHDNPLRLALFADELDDMFPAVAARTSYAGQTKRAAQDLAGKGPQEMAMEKGADLLEEMRGINQENAINAIMKLIEEN